MSQFSAPRSGVGAVVATVLVGLWTAGVGVALPALGWVADQLLLVVDLPSPPWLWPAVSLLAAVLVAGPALLLALIPRAPAIRAAGRAWLSGAVVLAVLGSARAVPVVHQDTYLLLLAVLAFGLHEALGRRILPATGPGLPLGVAAGLASLAPWLALGALGSGLRTLLAALAAAAVGALGGRLLNVIWPAFRAQSRARQIWLGGLVGAAALLPLAAGTGASGPHLLAMLVVPPLAFVAAALPGRGRPVTAMLALAAYGPLGLVEPIQTSVLLGLRDVGFWAAIAAGLSLTVAVLFSLGYGLSRRFRHRPAPAGALLALVSLGAATGYVTIGHPGLYGDQLFVVLKQQADLTGVAGIADLTTRRTEAYRRLVATAERAQAPLRQQLRARHIAFTPYYLVDGLQVDGGPLVRAWLETRSEVDRVLRSPRPRPLPVPAPPIVGGQAMNTDSPQWNVKAIGADQVWAGGDTGAGIVVGGSDTGVDGGHPALAGNFRGGGDSWYDPWNHTRTPTDHNGHGTHTLGTAVGTQGIGVAPGAQWMACVNLDRDLGNPAHYLDCLQFMLAPFPYGGDPFRDGRPARAADVLTNSWSCPGIEGCDRTALLPAVRALTAAGIFVVAAAGNSGPRCGSVTDPPAPYADSLTVGATDRSNRVAAFSSRGNGKPDVLAPGQDIRSAVLGGGYAVLAGTSMAAPHVAGVVALLWSGRPRLWGDVPATAAILRATAVPVGSDGCGTGAGLVDAAAAVAKAPG